MGVAVTEARRISDRMIAAAADELPGCRTPLPRGASLLPAMDDLRAVSAVVGIAMATIAADEGLSRVELGHVRQIHQAMWRPE